MPNWTVLPGDCVAEMAKLDANSVDSIVTDPPYELGFMGKAWDRSGVAFQPATWAEALRVLKPGGHLLAFGGTRTYHRMTVAIEDAGFEIRDTLMWLYGTGFPKSLDVSKAIDKAANVERRVIRPKSYELTDGGGYSGNLNTSKPRSQSSELTEPATPDAERWQGWGTALKPACEPIVLARKPFPGNVAANVLKHGTGALNIDASRIGTEQTVTLRSGHSGDNGIYGKDDRAFSRENPPGRWPANALLDEAAAAELDAQSGVSSDSLRSSSHAAEAMGYQGSRRDFVTTAGYGDSGGASRFFYVAKASTSERGAANNHPTVKPIALMTHLIRLVTPDGGLVLDPFLGSGTTAIAALRLGMRVIGIEQSEEYAELCKRRIRADAPMFNGDG